MRGWLDRLVGGVGLRRGRRDPDRLHIGDALDWWRVEDWTTRRRAPAAAARRDEGARPRLARADASRPAADAGSRYRQRAVFLPRGLAGHLYWWAVAPFHGLVFGGMVRNITRAAERDADT